MKKTLLSLALGLMVGSMSLSAQEAEINYFKAPAAESRGTTDDGFQLNFSNDIATWASIATAAKISYSCYLYITPDVASQLAGNKLTDINFSAMIESVGGGLKGTVFVSEDITADPVISQSTKIVNSYTGSVASIQTVALETPYEIKDNTGFYFGYTVENTDVKDYPVALDEGPAGPFPGYVSLKSFLTGASRGTSNIGEKFDRNMVLYANTVGDKKEINNVFALGNVSFGHFTLPVLDVTSGLNINVPLVNCGSNSATSVTYKTKVNDGDFTENTAEIDVPGNSMKVVTLPVPDVATGDNTVTFELVGINGVAAERTLKTSFIGVTGGYERRFVVEEGTGTWCGWCPRGIVGLETMSELYPDKFIGIAVHSGDNFEVTSYKPLISKFFPGFPSCIVNRDPLYSADPAYEELQSIYNEWLSQVGMADLSLQAVKGNASGSKMKVTTKTKFGLSQSGANYAIAFVVLEDGLVGSQSNYYAGGSRGEMGGWEKMPSTVNWTYYDTARSISNCWGNPSSVPTEIVEGEEYVYESTLMLTSIKKVANTAIVALLLDKNTGVILNAAKVKAADYGEYNGINDIEADDSDAPAEYYNMQGVRMDGNSLPAGVYIIKQGDTVNKAIIK